MDLISQFIDIFLHLDKYLETIITNYGSLTYLVLFIILFCETGLVVTPFLPGDSLIFAAAAFAAVGSLNIFMLIFILLLAAIIGDTVNYHIGKYLGPKALEKENKFIKKEHIEKTHKFYEKYGGKAIIIARFIPIVRTLAPFVAGVGEMEYKKFITYNIAGGSLWVVGVSLLGYFFGTLPVVEKNFTLVILGIIFISILPAAIEIVRSKLASKKSIDEAQLETEK